MRWPIVGIALLLARGLVAAEPHLYSDRLNLSLFERLQLRQIDPPRRPCQFGNGAPRSEREQSSLRFGFVSSVQKGTNSTDPSISCERKIGEMHWEGMVFHRYQLRAENFPPQQKYRLIVESSNGTQTETFTYLANKRGHLILLPPENVKGDLYAICPAKRGERLTFLMQLEGADDAYSTDFIPFPIEKKSKKGAQLSLELRGEKGEAFLFLAQGLKPYEQLELALSFKGEKIPLPSEVTQLGDLCKEIQLLEDPEGGDAQLILKRKNEEVVFSFQWGAPALKLVGACCFEIK